MKTDDNLSQRVRAKVKPVSITISIVEDDEPVRDVLAEWIRGADGFKCVKVAAAEIHTTLRGDEGRGSDARLDGVIELVAARALR